MKRLQNYGRWERHTIHAYNLNMSYRGFFDQIPSDIIDEIIKEGSHPSNCVYRALRNSSETVLPSDFLPSYMDASQPNCFIPPELRNCNLSSYVTKKISSYGVSLFENLDQLKKIVNGLGSMRRSVVGYAKGKTDNSKGITWLPDNKTHLEYFLYNSYGNNPCVDFIVIEKRNLGK